MTRAVLALGSNLGDRLRNLRAAVARLPEEGVAVIARSGVWETPPVPADQPPYLNAALIVETELPPLELLAALKRIESAMGRRPERRWGPRPLDLDILFYGEERVDLPSLQVPHPRILERAFVLAPLSDVFPEPMPHLALTPQAALASLGSLDARRICAL